MLLLVGGPLGIAASLLGLTIFLASCFGFEGALMFSILPLLLGAVGLIMTLVGSIVRRGNIEDTQVLAGLMCNLLAIIGALLEFSAWKGWAIFYKS